MADPIRFLTDWPFLRGQKGYVSVNAGLIIRQDPLQQAVRLIARNELRVWFEPDWRNARFLAGRFRHCLICSIPLESNTPSLHRIPGWRPRPNNGVV
jgi:hypothetical protein